MAKYSSDSDSDRSSRHRRKHRRRSRSTSSSSSDGSNYRKRSKHSKTKRRHRSRSRSRDKERSSRSYKSSKASSRERDRRRYQSRKSKSYSPDRTKKKLRSVSREKSTSRSSSSQSNVKTTGVDRLQNSTTIKEELAVDSRIKEAILDEINAERFVPKQFTSSAQSKQIKSSNIVIDITADTIRIPAIITTTDVPDSIFHTSVTSDGEARFEKWVKKLYTLRQKAIVDLSHASVT